MAKRTEKEAIATGKKRHNKRRKKRVARNKNNRSSVVAKFGGQGTKEE